MASLEQALTRHLECPLCYETLASPKLLTCGHTFCEKCLMRLLSSNSTIIACPLCRRETRVSAGDVSQLPVNVQVQSLLDYLANIQQKCADHEPEGQQPCSDVCLTCKKAISLSCRIQHHPPKNHNVLSNAEYIHSKEEEIQEMKETSKACFAVLERQNRYIDECRQNAITHIDQEIKKVNKKYDESVRNLTERRANVIRQLEQDKSGINGKFNNMKSERDTAISIIERAIELARTSLNAPLKGDTVAVHCSLFSAAKSALEKYPPKQADADVLERLAKSAQFTPYRGKSELNLGRLHRVEWKMVQKGLHAEDCMNVMTATFDGEMAVGSREGGAHFYTRQGELRTSKWTGMKISAIGFLSDGQCLVSDDTNAISLYQVNGEKADVTFETLSNDEGGICKITVDSDDLIYVSYRIPKKILVFKTSGGKAIREIPCAGYGLGRLFAFRSGKDLVVKSHKNLVRVIDQSGAMKCNVSHAPTYDGYPAVCWDDSIIIAWVQYETGIVSIDHYTSDLDHISTLIKDQRIDISKRRVYLQEFKSGDIAFCTADKLYIFQ